MAICVFRDGDRILAFHVPDSDEKGWRPLGGSIEFGETARDAIVREIREELGAELVEPRLLGTLENIFSYRGTTGHEIVFVFDGRLPDPWMYERDHLDYVEDGVAPDDPAFTGRAVWKRLEEFGAPGAQPLYPEGLLEFLEGLG